MKINLIAIASVILLSSCMKTMEVYTITAESNEPSLGTVTGGGTYYAGSTVVLTASSHEGSKFVKWTGYSSSTKNPLEITIAENRTYTAVFERTVYNYSDLPSFTFNGFTYKVAPDPHYSASQYISWDDANSYCENLTAYGYSDWRMPSIEELNAMYLDREAIGGFINNYTSAGYSSYYHSSTTNGSFYHLKIRWEDGEIMYYPNSSLENGTNGNYRGHVRPIRLDR